MSSSATPGTSFCRRLAGSGQRKLKAAKVTVIGAGGIGSAVIPALAGAGDWSTNTSSTMMSWKSPISIASRSFPKLTRGSRRQISRLISFGRPTIRWKSSQGRSESNPSNAEQLLGGPDLVIDGSDNFATRLAVSKIHVVHLGFPLLSAAAMQFQGQVGLFRSKALLSLLRRRRVQLPTIATIARNWAFSVRSLRWSGASGRLLAINAIVGIGEDQSGMLHLFDGEKLSWRAISIPGDPRCRTCGSA